MRCIKSKTGFLKRDIRGPRFAFEHKNTARLQPRVSHADKEVVKKRGDILYANENDDLLLFTHHTGYSETLSTERISNILLIPRLPNKITMN